MGSSASLQDHPTLSKHALATNISCWPLPSKLPQGPACTSPPGLDQVHQSPPQPSHVHLAPTIPCPAIEVGMENWRRRARPQSRIGADPSMSDEFHHRDLGMVWHGLLLDMLILCFCFCWDVTTCLGRRAVQGHPAGRVLINPFDEPHLSFCHLSNNSHIHPSPHSRKLVRCNLRDL